MNRILVTGGRKYRNRAYLFARLDELLPAGVLISGCCPTGADRFGEMWAEERRVPVDRYPAKWDDIDAPGARIRVKHGRAYNCLAGFQRNGEMLRLGMPTHAVAFTGGPGTDDMCAKIVKAIRFGAAIEFIDLRGHA